MAVGETAPPEEGASEASSLAQMSMSLLPR